jgi:cytochrome c biogenesis protein
MAATRAATAAAPRGDRLARAAERVLRLAGDGRIGLALLAATGLANAIAALLPDGPRLLDGPTYALLLGALALSGVAAVAVRAPAAWREWRRPGTVAPGSGAVEATVAVADPASALRALESCGYRARTEPGRRAGRWAVHGVRRGWARFAGILSHLALVVIVLGAATGAAFGSETVFTLLPGDQALLDAPRPGFSAAVRLDRFDAEFGADDRPRRLDTHVTFLRGGAPVRDGVLRVNEPGDFDGYLVHPWTYGPAARLRVTTLGGSALLDAPLPLDADRDGTPVGSTELPSVGLTVGLSITDAATNELGVSVVDRSGVVDSTRLRPGQSARVGDLEVEFGGFEAWVTLMSRRDPGLAILFAGAVLLAATLVVAFWLPRRRVTIRPTRAPGEARLVLRGERFDRPGDELARLTEALGGGRA